MRHWLTPRCILVALLLVAAPGAALAHLIVTWAPERLALARLNAEIARNARQLDAEWKQNLALREQLATLRESRRKHSAHGPRWLAARNRHAVFDQIAVALRDERVSIEQLTLDEPGLHAAVSRTNLLACERITVLCAGSYAGLTSCLDRIIGLDLPVRFTELSWGRVDTQLSLSLRLEVPFVPDDVLREMLANAAGLEDGHES